MRNNVIIKKGIRVVKKILVIAMEGNEMLKRVMECSIKMEMMMIMILMLMK